MSAFLVSKAHIDVLVTAATRFDRYDSIPQLPWDMLIADPVAFRRMVEPLPHAVGAPQAWRPRSIARRGGFLAYEDELGRALWLANAASIRARYGSGAEEATGEALDKIRAYHHALNARDPVTVIKACHCYAYQSCEVSDWDTSWAKAATDALERCAVRHLPGYEEAPWGID
jgi:hypothetical protein